MKAVVTAFNQEKALVGAFSVIVIVKTVCATDGSSYSTNNNMSNCTQLQAGGSGGYQDRAHWNNYKVTNLGTAAKTQNYIEHFPVPARRQEFNSGKRVYSINSLVLF